MPDSLALYRIKFLARAGAIGMIALDTVSNWLAAAWYRAGKSPAALLHQAVP